MVTSIKKTSVTLDLMGFCHAHKALFRKASNLE